MDTLLLVEVLLCCMASFGNVVAQLRFQGILRLIVVPLLLRHIATSNELLGRPLFVRTAPAGAPVAGIIAHHLANIAEALLHEPVPVVGAILRHLDRALLFLEARRFITIRRSLSADPSHRFLLLLILHKLRRIIIIIPYPLHLRL